MTISGLSLLLALSLAPRVFPPSTKTNTPNCISIWNQWTNGHSVDVPLQISIYLVYDLFIGL